VEQDPAAWSKSAVDIIRSSLQLRYGLLPYFYTLLHQSHISGTPVARPLFFDYANDINSRNVDDQFLIGSALLIAPIIEQGVTQRDVFFPRGRWFSLLDAREVPSSEIGRRLRIQIPLNSTAIYIRGGTIVPWQNPAVNTVLSRKNDFSILVALDENSRAVGSLYWDDGESINLKSSLVNFDASKANNQGTIRMKLVSDKYTIDPPLNNAIVYGISDRPSSVAVDGVQVPREKVEYDSDVKSLRLSQLGIRFDQTHTISWSF